MSHTLKIKQRVLPPSHLSRIDAMKLQIVSFLDESADIMRESETHREQLPADIIGDNGKTLIVYRHAGDKRNGYSISGWDVWRDGMFGGMNQSIHSALGWVERAREIRAGLRDHF